MLSRAVLLGLGFGRAEEWEDAGVWLCEGEGQGKGEGAILAVCGADSWKMRKEYIYLDSRGLKGIFICSTWCIWVDRKRISRVSS